MQDHPGLRQHQRAADAAQKANELHENLVQATWQMRAIEIANILDKVCGSIDTRRAYAKAHGKPPPARTESENGARDLLYALNEVVEGLARLMAKGGDNG